MPKIGSLSFRFWSKVDRRGENECWLWTAKAKTAGYGVITRGGRGEGLILAHRAAWLLTHGELPDDQVVRHKNECHNPLCCNPAHLELGERADNVADMWAKPDTPRGNAKLSEADVEAIRNDPRSSRKLAPVYGVTHSHIRSIRNKRAWPAL